MIDLAATVVDLLADGGDARLPSLTREELAALGDRPVLADATDVRWWQDLAEDSRALVAQTAQRGLIARNLLVPGPAEGPDLVVAPAVQVVLRARHEPAWLLVLGEPGTRPGSAGTQVALAGIDLAVHDTAAILVTARIEGIYAHRLTTVAIGLDSAVGWLLRAPEGAEQVGRTVEALLPPDLAAGAGLDPLSRRAIVLGTGREWVLSEVEAGTPGPPAPTGAQRLRALLVELVAAVPRHR